MRYWLVAAVPAMLWGQGAPVEGTVVNSVTHAGVPGVAVTIEGPTPRHVMYSTTTNADGTFRIGIIDQDGEYRVTLARSGYREVSPDDPALRPFRVAALTGTVRLQLQLAPLPRFRGRVVDAAGHPAPDVRVELVGGSGPITPTAVVGKDGTFVYEGQLPSHPFVVRAVPLKAFPLPASEETAPMAWAPTYYPDAAERSQAARIAWRGDADLEGYEIRLRAVRVFHMRGTVLDETGKPAAGATVKLVPPDSWDTPILRSLAQPETQSVTASDGAFDLPAVRPGDWVLAAEWKRDGQSLSGFVNGRVSDKDWEDARIHLEVPFAVKGVVEKAGGAEGQPVHVVADVKLVPADGGPSPMAVGPVMLDGHFELRGVHRGLYRIVTSSGNDAAYADSVQFGGREVLGQPVEVTDGVLPIRVIAKANGGRVQGTVERCSFAAALPKDPRLRYGQFVGVASCDSGGRFEIGALRPGDYYAIAFDRTGDQFLQLLHMLEMGRPDPVLAAAAVANGENVHVDAGQSTMVTLKLTTFPEQ